MSVYKTGQHPSELESNRTKQGNGDRVVTATTGRVVAVYVSEDQTTYSSVYANPSVLVPRKTDINLCLCPLNELKGHPLYLKLV